MRLVGASAREGMLAVEELLKWALLRVGDASADAPHVAAAAVLPMLQACIWVRALKDPLGVCQYVLLCPPSARCDTQKQM